MRLISGLSLLFLVAQLRPTDSRKQEAILDIGYVLFQGFTYVNVKKGCYETYENIMNNIKDMRKIVDLADRNHEHVILPTDLLDDAQQSWSKLGEYFQNDPTFNKYNLIESISNKKGVNDMKVGLSIIESKLNNKMIGQVQNMVKGQTIKAACRTANMIKNLKETYDLIQKSEQYRKSTHLQLALNNSKAYIDGAEKNYLMAIDEMKKIEITNEAYIEPLKLEKITIKLEKSQFECEKAN
ncbi:unnamed protein product, partial [Adineta ricciae]